MPFALTCSSEGKKVVTVTPQTKSGKPAPIDGALKVSVTSGDGTFAQDAANPLNFDAISGAVVGDTVYLVEGDADLGAGVVSIQDTVTLTVTSAGATGFAFAAGPEVPKV